MPIQPIDVTPATRAGDPKPQEPELVEVQLLEVLLKGHSQPMGWSARPDLGDSITETPEAITVTSGKSGQVVVIDRSSIAIISKVTRMVRKDLPTKEPK